MSDLAPPRGGYQELLRTVLALVEQGRRSAARAVNAVLTTTYWRIGEYLVRHEQGGLERAEYGTELLKRLSQDLSSRLGRGFSERNLDQMRQFYLQWPNPQTPSADSSLPDDLRAAGNVSQTASAKSVLSFPLSWSHYVRLLSVPDPEARRYYEAEAREGGWSVRQLDRQMATLA